MTEEQNLVVEQLKEIAVYNLDARGYLRLIIAASRANQLETIDWEWTKERFGIHG